MPKIIDKTRVIEMAIMGFAQVEIAKRLGCSCRQVRRIIKQNPDLGKSKNIKMDKIIEPALRQYFLAFESGERTAERFGLTRQAILK